MRVADELRAHQAAGSLAEELPYWGWLDDGRTCLTRSGELIAAGRLRPAAVDGRTPEQVDRVLGLWQRLLSGLSPGARLYFHLLRRPAAAARAAEDHNGSDIAAVSKRKRAAFLKGRVQRLDAYVVWSHGSGLRPVARSTRPGPFSWLARLRGRRSKGAPTYLASEIEAAAARFRAMVEAGRSLVAEHTPVELLGAVEGSRLLSELINRPGMPWDGATGSGMNWRLALSELEAERSHLRLDGEPVILYSLLSPPGQAHANLLRDLYCLDATLSVSLEWRPWTVEAARRRIRGAQRHYFSRRYSMMSHVQETQGTAAAMVDSAAAVESDRLGAALVELEADGVAYGEASLTVALHGDLAETERLDGDVRRLFAAHDAKAVREGYGQLPVWFSRLPAQPPKRQIRKVFVSAGLAACMAPVFGPPRGSARSGHLDREALAVFDRLWATIMKERFEARSPRSMMMRFHTQTGGATLTAQQPENNIVRTTLQALAAVLGGTQSLHTNSMDEALSLPTEKAVQIALRTQQVIGFESGVGDVIDPLGGSWYIESMTDRLEGEARDYLKTIEDLGGAPAALEQGFQQREIQEASYRYQREIEEKDRVIVGVNDFTVSGEEPPELLRVDPSIGQRQVERLQALRAERDNDAADAAIAALEEGARGTDNLVPLIVAAVEARATLGEISHALRRAWGEYREIVVV